MAYNKRNWKARQGTGLNFFSIDGATPVPIVNQPTTLTEAGDALSAGNLNDWEQRIADAFDDADASIANVQAQVDRNAKEIENLKQTTKQDEQTVSYPDDGNYSSIMPDGVPSRVAKYAEVRDIRGKTRAWNRLVKSSDFVTGTSYDVIFSVTADGELQLSGTCSGDTQIQIVTNDVDACVAGHKYLLIGGTANFMIRPYDSADWDTGSGVIFTAQSTNSLRLAGMLVNGTVYNQKTHIFVRDLTLIFGAGNEPATVADALKALPDLAKYDSFGYSLVDTTVTGVEASVPYDGWDNLMENGYISQGTGQNVGDDSNYKRSTSYVPVTPSTKYRMRYPSYGGVILYYGSDKSYIGSGSLAGSSYEFVTGNNVYYIRFWFNYWQTYNNDIYVSDFATLMLSSPFTGKSAGSVAEVLDVQTGKKTRPIATIDMKDMEYSATEGIFVTRLPNSKQSSDCGITTTGLTVAPWKSIVQMVDGDLVWSSYEDYYYIKDTSCTTAEEMRTKYNGWLINYELATPLSDEQVCDPIPGNYTEVQANGTIRTIQSQTPVIDNCLDVTYDFIPA